MGPRFVSGNCFTNSIQVAKFYVCCYCCIVVVVIVIVLLLNVLTPLRMTSKKDCQLKCIMSKKVKIIMFVIKCTVILLNCKVIKNSIQIC